jgi:hypothetical protein
MMFDPTKSASHTLEAIRLGGQSLVALAMVRLNEAETALADGRFTDADRILREALHKVHALSEAQGSIGIFGDTTRIVRAGDLEPGTHILDWGTVESLEFRDEEHPIVGACRHVVIHLEGEELPRELNVQTELLVAVD